MTRGEGDRVKETGVKKPIDFASRFPPRHLEAARLRGLEASRLSDRGQLGVTLGSIFMKITEDNGRKVKNGRQKRHIDVEWHL